MSDDETAEDELEDFFALPPATIHEALKEASRRLHQPKGPHVLVVPQWLANICNEDPDA